MGDVILRLNNGSCQRFDNGVCFSRAATEFRSFADAIHSGKHNLCLDAFEKSITVSQVMTHAWLKVGSSSTAVREKLTRQFR